MRRRVRSLRWAAVGAALALGTPPSGGLDAQPPPPVGRDAALALPREPLEWTPPSAELHHVGDVPVLFLRDPALPLVDVFARFAGGYAHFGRERYAAATALPALLRSGGTAELPPDSVDELLDFYALQTSFQTGGGSVASSVNTLVDNLDSALGLWTEILRRPRFDPAQVEIWRGRELERVRRRTDDAGSLAVSEFNRIMYGDHPVGWELEPEDLGPEKLTPAILADLHRRILCRENLVLGVAGDVAWREVAPRLERYFADWPRCVEELPEPPDPHIRDEPAVFVLPRALSQTVIVMAEPTPVTRTHPDYFASRIANSVLGAGGLTSRLMNRIRTEKGWAYGASSFWTTPRDHDGVVGAFTRARGEHTVAAARLVREIMTELRREPPTDEEVATAVDGIVNGFVFNFESAAQIVAREVFYVGEEIPRDWLSRFLEGIQTVRPEDVQGVFETYVHPDRMTVLLVGDPEAFDEPAEALGPPVRILTVNP